MNKNILSKWYWIMPNIILFNEWLKDKEKLLYCFISSLCAKTGYCWALNWYLVEQLKNKTPKTTLTKGTVSKYVNSLKKQGYIDIDYQYEWRQVIGRKISLSDIGAITMGGMVEIDTTPSGNQGEGIVEMKKDNSIIYNNINNINNKNWNSLSKTVKEIKKVRDHLDIVNEYETSGTFNLKELMSKSVENTWETSGLEKLAVVFLDYYVANKDKLKGKVNIKARFNKFVLTDYHNLLTKKLVWTGIDNVTDEQMIELMDAGHFRTPTCKFYCEQVRPTLDLWGLKKLNVMLEFFRNKDIAEKKWLRFNQWVKSKEYECKICWRDFCPEDCI